MLSTASAVATSDSWLSLLWSAETSLPRWPWRSVFAVVTAWRASSAPTIRLPAVRWSVSSSLTWPVARWAAAGGAGAAMASARSRSKSARLFETRRRGADRLAGHDVALEPARPPAHQQLGLLVRA